MADNEILQSTAVDAANEYDASEIQVLEGLEAVRKRPGMYIGSTSSSGLHHLVYEIVDNAIDEALAGYCSEISVTINEGNTITVVDNGRGIPVDIQAQTGKPALEVVYTVLHAGGKFGGGGYKVSGGLHGVGASVVNALSEWLVVQVHRDGKIHEMKFARGHVTEPMTIVGTTDHTGTTVTFKPDPEMFEETVYSYDILHTRMREEAFLNAGLRITIADERLASAEKPEEERRHSMCYEGGIREFVTYLNRTKTPLHEQVIYVSGQKGDSMAEIAMQYNDGYNETTLSFANNVHTPEGGMHEEGFRRALTTVLNNYGRKIKMLKDDEKVSGEDCREGLTCVISVKLTDAQFEGQTKAKLGNSDIRTLVNNIVSEKLDTFLEENPQVGRMILDKALTANRAREAAKKARESIRRKTALGGAAMPDKLRDCNENNPELTELYIVEGDSAGGSAKTGRDREFQAILPLRGKILNVEKASVDKLLDSEQIKTLVLALGTQLKEDFDIEKLRYHRIILMTDADVDGAHIRTLLLTFFYRQMPQLLERGHVYIAQPPLYGVLTGRRGKNNVENKIYIKDDAEMEQYLLDIALEGAALYRNTADFEAGICLRGTDLENMIAEFEQSKSVIERLSLVIDRAALMAIASGVAVDLSDLEKAQACAQALEAEIRDPEIKVKAEIDSEKERVRIRVSHHIYGNTHNTFIEQEFLRSNEYRILRDAATALEGVVGEGARAVRGDSSQPVKNFGEAVKWFMDQAEAGVKKQRYKGLGEMGAEELYETTMNPQTRRLLRVRLEDASKADDIFSMLMGDEVEPRREFIEDNAIFVSNLDI